MNTVRSLNEKFSHVQLLLCLELETCPVDVPPTLHGQGTLTFTNRIFLNYQPRQLIKNDRHFRDHLCPYYQDLMIRS
jgi:hypothetical protein